MNQVEFMAMGLEYDGDSESGTIGGGTIEHAN